MAFKFRSVTSLKMLQQTESWRELYELVCRNISFAFGSIHEYLISTLFEHNIEKVLEYEYVFPTRKEDGSGWHTTAQRVRHNSQQSDRRDKYLALYSRHWLQSWPWRRSPWRRSCWTAGRGWAPGPSPPPSRPLGRTCYPPREENFQFTEISDLKEMSCFKLLSVMQGY